MMEEAIEYAISDVKKVLADALVDKADYSVADALMMIAREMRDIKMILERKF